MNIITARLLLSVALVLCFAALVDHLRSQCLHDGRASVLCPALEHPYAAMTTSLISLPANFLRQTARGAHTLRHHMPRAWDRGYASDATGATSFTYRLAAAAAGKKAPPRQPKPGQDFWTYTSTQSNQTPPYLRSSKPDSGEDAFFATTIGGSKHDVAFGLADGVGGWQDQGVDPSVFSHGLCGLMAGTAYLHDQFENGKQLRPQSLMQVAYDAVIGNPRIVAGGCTASLAVADAKGSMETAKYVRQRIV